ncbi:helix-turn-helix domain-containing protein [Nocardia australiensis]|uniref:helix-turn-helix domain-containing protein n=1 Tax=Nocardia australiensis TaxID=2887191 RepID=UPI001D1331AB|nr:helix-turn-helix transcriptional regulator [Nocardia australiensis]
MTSPDEEGPSSTLPRRQLGRFLRDRREATGFTLAEAAKLVDLSRAVLQRLETGQIQKIRRQDAQALCEVYGVDAADTKAAVDLAVQAKAKSWYHAYGGLYSSAFNMYVGLEAAARRLTTYHEHVPGLLQTADYARAVIGAYPEFDGDDIDRRVEHRLRRQAIITRKTSPAVLEVMLHESALHRIVGGPKIMAAQHRHLAEISKRPNVMLRIHPFSAGLIWGMPHGLFTIVEFDTNTKGEPVEPPIVCLEGGPNQDVYLEKYGEVKLYSELASAIRSTCLDEVETRDLLRRVARSYNGER